MVFLTCRRLWALHDKERKKCFSNAVVKIGNSILYKCSSCGLGFDYKSVQCDHIIPISNSRPDSKEEFLESFFRLHVSFDMLQILCLTCHKAKTKREIQQKWAKNL